MNVVSFREKSNDPVSMRVGLIYDLFGDYPWREGEPFDADAENEPSETVDALEAALRALGHEPVRVGPARRLASMLFAGPEGADRLFDVAVNIAEGAHHRNREGEAPTLLDLVGIPYVGSDALTLSLSLDKAWTKDLAVASGVRTPAWWIGRVDGVLVSGQTDACRRPGPIGCADAEGAIPRPFPLFVKPRYEGSAKGITAGSLVSSEEALRPCVERMTRAYGQDVLIERYIHGGGEFTVAVVGHRPARTLPVIQRAVDRETEIGVHVLERTGLDAAGMPVAVGGFGRVGTPGAEREWILPGDLTPELERRLAADALAVYHKLECRDFARVDFRVDAEGSPWFLEINPLPTFAPDGTFAIMAELMGQTYEAFLADVLQEALIRALRDEPTDQTASEGRR